MDCLHRNCLASQGQESHRRLIRWGQNREVSGHQKIGKVGQSILLMCKNHWVSWIVPIIKSGVTIMLGTWKEQGTVFQGRPHLTPFHPSFSPSLLPSPTDSQRGKLWGPSSSNLDAPSLIYSCSHSSKGDMVGPNRPADHTALGRTTAPNSFHWGLLRGAALVS